ncbi:hypothetical protein CSOJ01_15358 [Colletotrichum sojae]|uniref:Uncharacterized protein n=1 Tax=Colletotrichum sojae TaxID=2175907 RepID=A0A8H6MHY2_9PEZI|nr:hypothetical protein CSOJ01_15358 [Colletotrichum sojae]
MEAAERTMAGRERINTSHTFFDRSTSPPTVNISQVLEIDQAARREILYYLDAVDPHFKPTFLPLEALQPGYRGPVPRGRSLSTKRAQTETARAAWETAMQHAAERELETPDAEWYGPPRIPWLMPPPEQPFYPSPTPQALTQPTRPTAAFFLPARSNQRQR